MWGKKIPHIYCFNNKYKAFLYYILIALSSSLNLSAIIAINSEFVGLPLLELTV